jgi:hypothetical protein
MSIECNQAPDRASILQSDSACGAGDLHKTQTLGWKSMWRQSVSPRFARPAHPFRDLCSIDRAASIVSRLARGVDCYPKENKKLYEKVLERGAIISEFPTGLHPAPENSPVRNRIKQE